MRTLLLHWGLPIAAMIAAIVLSHPAKTLVWIAALSWMGVACLINARRCGRTHCYLTGPFLLIMVLPVFLHGFGYLPLGAEGWKWLGVVIGAGSGAVWCLSEGVLGKYRA